MPKAQVLLRTMLFDADGSDRRIDEGEIDLSVLGENQLLWIDLQDNEDGEAAPVLERLLERLDLEGAGEAIAGLGGKPRLRNYGDWFLVEVAAVECSKHLAFNARGMALL